MERKVGFQEAVEYGEHKGLHVLEHDVNGLITSPSQIPVVQRGSELDSASEEKAGWGSMEEETYKTFQDQDEKWKGADVDARQHLSHREAHSEFRTELSRAIMHYQIIEEWVMLIHCKVTATTSNNRMRWLNQDILRIIAEFSFAPGHGAVVQMLDQNLHQSYLQHEHYRRLQQLQKENTLPIQPFFIYIRKRPLLPYELQRGNYNVVDINTYDLDSDALTRSNSNKKDSPTKQPFSNLVEVHDGKLARNGRILDMKHKVFAVSEAFSEHVGNEEVCLAAVEPLVAQVYKGLPATILYYGQTGTGKTHTLLGSLKYIATRFAGCEVNLTFYEIRGKKSYDLLNDRAIVHLRSDENENVHVRGCREVNFKTLVPKEFMAVLKVALGQRSSKATERNPVSSRSHAICTIDVITDANRGSGGSGGGGGCRRASLRLVDLAGSERNYETSEFTAADHRDSAQINFALLALKNCFRTYNAACTEESTKHRAPYRASLLTRVLRECFVRGSNHTTSVIATVSPSPTDLEHTLNTLEHVTMMDPALEKLPIQRCTAVDVMIDGCAQPNSPVDTWTHRQVMAWLSHTDGGKFAQLVLPANMSGSDLMHLNMKSLTALCAGQLREAREGDEGSAWVEQGETTKGQLVIAKRLFAVLRREQNASLLRQSKVHQSL